MYSLFKQSPEEKNEFWSHKLSEIGIRAKVLQDKIWEALAIGSPAITFKDLYPTLNDLRQQGVGLLWNYNVEEMIIAQDNESYLRRLIEEKLADIGVTVESYLDSLLKSAVTLNKASLVNFLMTEFNVPPYGEEMLKDAAYSGNVKLFSYLEQKGLIPTQVVFEEAAYGGNIEIIEYLMQQKGFELTAADLEKMARKGNLQTLKYIMNIGFQPNQETLNYAAFYGDMERFKYLEEMGIKPTQKTLNSAARGGKLNIILYLEQQQFQPDQKTLDVAPQGCNIELLNYLIYEKKLNFSKAGIRYALEIGAQVPHISDYVRTLFQGEYAHLENDLKELSDPKEIAERIESYIESYDYEHGKPPCLII